ncbi:APC family permease [Streptomyces sp. NPDC005283]|uniref:APC family permease n=1 Tax=Streptomyces sp. NPDC005283 TaxID=3156871 RepID=UPI00345437D3
MVPGTATPVRRPYNEPSYDELLGLFPPGTTTRPRRWAAHRRVSCGRAGGALRNPRPARRRGRPAGPRPPHFIGLDAVSTAGEEVRNPRRTLPLAIICALVVVTAVYVLVALVGVGAQPWTAFAGQEAGLSEILAKVTGAGWPGVVLSAGAVLSIVSVTLVVLYGQTRILYSMGRDGMLPAAFHRVDRRTGTPVLGTVIVGAFVALLAAVFSLDILADLTSLGTLVAFAVVLAGVIILRRTAPGLDRGFKVPGYPVGDPPGRPTGPAEWTAELLSGWRRAAVLTLGVRPPQRSGDSRPAAGRSPAAAARPR